jgi:hypothetical protein
MKLRNLFEGTIRQDAELLLDQLKQLKIITKGYVSSTGHGARGKNKIYAYPDAKYNTYSKFTDIIRKHFKKVGNTAMSSAVYSNGKVHFYYWLEGNKFEIIVRRKNYNGIK